MPRPMQSVRADGTYNFEEVKPGDGVPSIEHIRRAVSTQSSGNHGAALLVQPDEFQGRRVGIILSGGNVDPDKLPWG